jgi:4-oxalocrotonate tautomerase
MPMIRIEMFEGRTVEQKRACAKAVTEAFLATCGGRLEAVEVIFTDIAQHNWASGGKLFSDPK